MGDLRVSFGLRDCATDSEEESWERDSDLASAFSSDSDADSFAAGFGSETHFDCHQTLASQPRSQTGTPTVQLNKALETPAGGVSGGAKSGFGPGVLEPAGGRDPWANQDKVAKNPYLHQARTRYTPPVDRQRPRQSGRGRKKRQQPQPKQGNNTPGKEFPLDASSSENWGDKSRKNRKSSRQNQRPCSEKKIPARRPGRQNAPLTGAVVRPFTLPAGPITILRRPAPVPAGLEDNSDNGMPEGLRHSGSASQAQKGRISPDPVFPKTFDSPPPSLCNGSQGSQNDVLGMCGLQMTLDSNWKSHIVHVTTKYGPGIVVENPKTEATESKLDGSDSENEERLKAAKDAAELAMAGLTMGKDGKDILPLSTNSKQAPILSRRISADTYNRVYSGSVDKGFDDHHAKNSRKKNRGGRSRGPRNHNAPSFDTPKLLRSVHPKSILTHASQGTVPEITARVFCREMGEV